MGVGSVPGSVGAPFSGLSSGSSLGSPLGEASGGAAPDQPASDRFALPTISLPKGGGAVRGVDEKLTVGLATGSAGLTAPIPTTPGRAGFGPALALRYDSGAGAGAFGLGWRVGVAAITRKTSLGLPQYQDDVASDVFVLSEAEDLVPALVEQGGAWVDDQGVDPTGTYTVFRYRPRVEAGFARVERWQNIATGDVHWRVVSGDNVTRLFGLDAASRIADPADPTRIFSWLLDLSYDDRGNAISYEYKPEDGAGMPAAVYEVGRVVTANRYLKRIYYGNTVPYLPGSTSGQSGSDVLSGSSGDLPTEWRFEVVFDYGEHDMANPTPVETTSWPCRVDAFSSYRSRFEVRTQRLCRRILMFHHFPDELGVADLLVHSTDLTYSTDAAGDASLPISSLLTSVTQNGYIRLSGGGYSSKQLPPLEFGYSPVALHDVVRDADSDTLANLPTGGSGQRWQWTDLDGEGIRGVLTEDDGAWFYKRNVSAYSPDGSPPRPRFEPMQAIARKPAGPGAGSSPQLIDLHGDGHLCAVDFAPPTPGYFERDDSGGWLPFTAFPTTAAIDWASPNVRAIDLDGDGLADVLLTEDDAFTWFPWLAHDGFGPPVRVVTTRDEVAGPALVFAEGDSSIFLADMSGDGLTDLVRIRNGEVCYWPNIGYGHFGAKVIMDAAPWFDQPDLFSAGRIQLADIDGSGTADLIYSSGSGVRIWFNQSGNSFTAPSLLSAFPDVDDVATIVVMDLLGSGTACLTWSSSLPAANGRQLRYIDLMGGIKPHLLTSVTNNVGVETTLTYSTSTSFYLQDRLAGRPWVTRLAFPVHVVSQQEVLDQVSGTRLVSTYSYHHGLFDSVEREFRGFGMVEQSDAESVSAASGTGSFTQPPTGSEFDLPPVRTRSWFHTGAYVGGADIAEVLATEYYAGDAAAVPLAGTLFEGDSTVEELREACRALRGRPLRTEIYADDGSAQAAIPYSVADYRYRVSLLQPPQGVSYGSVYASELESRTFHYERNSADPRVGHEFTLERDQFGAVTKSASVGYRRRLTGAVAEQAVTLAVYAEHDVVNLIATEDCYRVGVPAETRTFELTGLGAPDDGSPFDPQTLLTQAVSAATIPFESVPDTSSIQKRLISRTRVIYRADDLSAPLSLGQVDSLAIVDRSYTLIMTPGLANQVYSAKTSTASSVALAEGGFVDLDADGCWWAPSPSVFYSPNPSAPDVTFAQQHFYLPQGHVDPFGGIATVQWANDLVVASTTDPVGNTATASVNYRVVQPWLMTDPNANRSGVRYDELGMVIASALMGKALPDGSDEGDHLDLSTAEASATDDPTSTLDYNLDSYRAWASNPAHDPLHPTPIWVHSRTRVRHKDPTTPWLETFTYSDGMGRVALTKAKAEPGDAPVIATDGTVTFAPTTNRWVGSGKVIYDNKAHPIKAYEPFFDSNSDYTVEQALVEWGVTAITRYDSLGRVIRVDKPDGTFTSVDFGPWRQLAYDENDNVLASAWYSARSAGGLGVDQQDAATKAAADTNTPLVSDFDPLGRVFHTIADGVGGKFETYRLLDIGGHVLSTIDALDRAVLTSVYDVGGAVIATDSIDAGQRWMLSNVGGQQMRVWDSRGQLVRNTYDAARRLLDVFVTPEAATEVLAESMSYGESQLDAVANNLRGASYQQRDGAGLATSLRRDFKGNVLDISRQLLAHVDTAIDWSTAMPMAVDVFTTSTTYDALNRVVTTTTPDGSVTAPVFNERSLLAGMTLSLAGGAAADYVESVVYDPKGQRQSISYGNSAVTTYSYEPETFRLARLITSRSSGGSPVQDLSYTYDPVGNVTRIEDAAQSTIFFANQLVAPISDYTYDVVNRLISASGREHIGQTTATPTSWDDSTHRVVPLPTDPQAMRNYTESYAYDLVGNITAVTHNAVGGSWTRTYSYDPATPPVNNRLVATQVGASTESYSYDANGNMTSMPQLSLMAWDFMDLLETTAQRVVNIGTPETTWYRYDVSGQRVRKATLNAGGVLAHERIYLGGYEIYREYSSTGAVTLERQTVLLPDVAKHLAIIETTTVGSSKPAAPTIRYQFANHLDSACVELDENAAVISYEEYYPYGATSFQAGRSAAEVGLKRYRFTAKERDDESGLDYHGARYYAPWLGRWTSADPAGLVDGPDLYAYVRGNPIRFTDPAGKAGDDSSDIPFYKKALIVAKVGFTMAVGQTPEHFGQGVVDKVKSLTVDPVMVIYGPGGMINKAADKMVDRMQGIQHPDDYYVSKEEHDNQLKAIVAVGGGLFPGIGETTLAIPGPKLVTPEGVVVTTTAPVVVPAVVSQAPALLMSAGSGAKSGTGSSGAPKEPGAWTNDATAGQNMNAEQAKYQKQITKKAADKTYHVKGRSFDGYEPGRNGAPGKLVEAKHLGDEGRFAKAYENMKKGNYGDIENLIDRAEKILDQAKEQVKAASGTGAQVEWRVSGQHATEALQTLFDHEPAVRGKITVTHVPLVK